MITELEAELSREEKINLIEIIKKYSLLEKNVEFAIEGVEFKFELEDVNYYNGKLILIYKRKNLK
jgi:hypothetical protein